MNHEPLLEQARKIKESGALGKSQTFERLFDYLVERTIAGNPPKEAEIAIDVFGRDGSFDANQDSLVRVYVFNLRNKISAFYEDAGAEETEQLIIPKGTYGIQLISSATPVNESSGTPDIASPAQAKTVWLLSLLLIFSLIGLLYQRFATDTSVTESPMAEQVLWKGLLEPHQETPLLIVLGDIFMLAELNDQYEQTSEIHNFAINSAEDFDLYIGQHSELQSRYRVADITYLPSSVAFGLANILPILRDTGRTYELVRSSELTREQIENHPILYLGFFSSLQSLKKNTFDHSSFRLHPSAVVLIDKETGDIYAGEGELSQTFTERYLDYGLIIRRENANGMPQLFFMASRDYGLRSTLEAFSTQTSLHMHQQINRDILDPNTSFEFLYEISGYTADTLEQRIAHMHRLDEP